MISVKLGPISRPATEVISASSEYSRFDGVLGDSSLPASALLGEQEVARARHSDDGKSWSPARGAAGEETLTLRFGSSLYPTKVVLYENLSPGSLSKVEARYPNGTYVTVWMGVRDPLEQRPMGFPAPNGFLSTGGSSAYDLKPAGVQTDILRLSFTTPPWPEIDTIKMVGYAELLPTAEMASGLGAVDAVVQRNGLPKQVGRPCSPPSPSLLAAHFSSLAPPAAIACTRSCWRVEAHPTWQLVG